MRITPKILNVYAKAFMDEKKLVQKTSIYQAYLISRWVWQKKVDIEKILNTEKKKAMTDEQMLEKVKALNAIFGGEVKVIGKE